MFEWLGALVVWLAEITSPEYHPVAPANPPQTIPYEVFAAALEHFPGEVDDVLCICRYESQFRSHVVGAAGEAGVMQIHPINWYRLGTNGVALTDPREAMRVAALIKAEAGGWWPWSARHLCGLS